MSNGKDKYTPEIMRSFRRTVVGGYSRTNPANSFAETASSDEFCSLKNKYGFANAIDIEIKTAIGGLSFGGEKDGWKANQMEYGQQSIPKYGKPYFLAVMFVHPLLPKINLRTKKDDNHRQLYFVPFDVAYETCNLLTPYQKTIPLFISQNSYLPIKERKLCADNLWQKYKVRYDAQSELWLINEVIYPELARIYTEIMTANAEASGDINEKTPSVREA